jgi:hypothetical protein
MLFNIKKWSLAGLILLSSSMAYAAPTTSHFGGVADGGNSFNQFSVTTDDVTVTVSGWSDTKNHTNKSGKLKDVKIERAKYFDKNTSGSGSWAMTNMDEANGGNNEYGHSADNFGSGAEKDYDFFMLAFSEAVSLTQATYGWISGGSSKVSQNQVSVVALNSATVNNTLSSKTWGNVKNKHTLSSDYAQMQESVATGYYTNFTGTNVEEKFSTHWLIGALNSKFGGTSAMEGNDGMKLAGVSFNKAAPEVTSVPEPSSILLFCLAIIGLATSGRRKLQ